MIGGRNGIRLRSMKRETQRERENHELLDICIRDDSESSGVCPSLLEGLEGNTRADDLLGDEEECPGVAEGERYRAGEVLEPGALGDCDRNRAGDFFLSGVVGMEALETAGLGDWERLGTRAGETFLSPAVAANR